ncbi:MAG: ABC transporter ATP-binding protein/permease [Lachnospiraceae bacterium]|nr:ABC transporter ATP-binding protein/permease [Lachnospiraceae bacterium]
MKQLNGLKGLLPYLLAKKGSFLLIFLLSVLDAALAILPIQLIGMIVDVLSTGESFLSPFLGNRVEHYVILFVVVYIAKQGIDILRGHKNTLLAQKIIEEVRDDAMGWAMESYRPYKEERKEGDLVSRLSGDVDAVVRAVAGPLNGLLPMLLRMMACIIVLFVWNPLLGLIAMALIFPLVFSSRQFSLKGKENAAAQRAASGRFVSAVSDILYSIPVIKAWESEGFESKEFHGIVHEIYELNRGFQRKVDGYWCLTYFLMAIGYVSAVVLSTRSVLAGTMTIGNITVAYSYMSNVLNPAVSLSRYGNDLFQADAALQRVFELKPEGKEKAAPMRIQSAPKIAFKDVTIVCNESKRIQNLSFTALPHQLVILLGESGSGKSTILQTLLGNQGVETGRILVDDVDMTGRLGLLREAAAVSFQQSYLFDRSLAGNVAYACEKSDFDRVKEALQASGLGTLTAERGLGFRVGTKGKFLSGGEQRRVAFARALYKGAVLYLLDEPTSELDMETGKMILDEILRLKEEATVIVATHDPELAARADAVVRL